MPVIRFREITKVVFLPQFHTGHFLYVHQLNHQCKLGSAYFVKGEQKQYMSRRCQKAFGSLLGFPYNFHLSNNLPFLVTNCFPEMGWKVYWGWGKCPVRQVGPEWDPARKYSKAVFRSSVPHMTFWFLLCFPCPLLQDLTALPRSRHLLNSTPCSVPGLLKVWSVTNPQSDKWKLRVSIWKLV